MKNPGIHIRLLGAAFLFIIIATFILNVAGVYVTRQFMHKRFKDRIVFLAKYLASNSEVGVLIRDRSGLNILALNLLGEEDVTRVTIMDNIGNILVDQYRKVRGPLSVVEAPVVFKINRDENLLFRSDIKTPFGDIKTKGEDYIGKVRITFSTHGIDQLMKEIAWQFSLLCVCFAILAGVVFYLISRPIVRDVSQLAITARQVGRGDLELRARPGNLPETRDLSLAFNAMLDSLEASRKAFERVNQEMIQQKALAKMGSFSLMIAHEVKNPLSIINSSLDVLIKELSLSSKNTMVVYIKDEIKRLNRLIEDFLMFARPVKPTIRSVDLNGMLRDIVERFEIQQQGLALDIESRIPLAPCNADVDKDLLTRGLSNIIKNACEANNENGRVCIDASVQDDIWTVEVNDQGEGIDPKNISKIFEPFFTTRSKGTGLGLAFASQVVKSHGGIVMAENREQGGARFRVELPIKTREHNV
jgi:signal transduction histidine kinase